MYIDPRVFGETPLKKPIFFSPALPVGKTYPAKKNRTALLGMLKLWFLDGGFKYVLCSSVFREMIQFDEQIFRRVARCWPPFFVQRKISERWLTFYQPWFRVLEPWMLAATLLNLLQKRHLQQKKSTCSPQNTWEHKRTMHLKEFGSREQLPPPGPRWFLQFFCEVMNCWVLIFHHGTPPKINGWNPKIGSLGRCVSFSKGAFSGSTLILGGVNENHH